jgi:hypothetical protein
VRALIHEREDRIGAGAFDIAGRPLVVRQLQVLRELGIEEVVVEVCEGPRAPERAAWLLGSDPLVSKVTVVPSGSPLGVAELARRAGLEPQVPFVSLAADTLFHAPIDLARVPARYDLTPPRGTDLTEAEVSVESLTRRATSSPEALGGWGARVTSEGAAHQLGCAALAGSATGVMIHAAEVSPGVWAARGAHIAEDATVHAPVLLGVDAVVLSRASVGPRVVIGDRAVIEREATVADAIVEPDTLVGESTQLKHVCADARGTTQLSDGRRHDVTDPLVLASRGGTATLGARLAALALLVVLALPWLCVALVRRLSGKPSASVMVVGVNTLRQGEIGVGWLDVAPCLMDVLAARRDLVGVNDRKALQIALSRPSHGALRAGALDISRSLAPGANVSTLLRMWRWYTVHKDGRLDRRLLAPKAARKNAVNPAT